MTNTQQITNVQQLYKTIFIEHVPSDIKWSFNSLVSGALFVDMKQYCEAQPGVLTCTMPNIPDCDYISLIGTLSGDDVVDTVDETNSVHLVRQFNCTVYHLDEF